MHICCIYTLYIKSYIMQPLHKHSLYAHIYATLVYT